MIYFRAILITTEISKMKVTSTLNNSWWTSLFPLKTSLLQKRLFNDRQHLEKLHGGFAFIQHPFLPSPDPQQTATQALWKVDINPAILTINCILIYWINTLTYTFIFRGTSSTSPLTHSPSLHSKQRRNNLKVTKILVWLTSRGTRNSWNIWNSLERQGTGNIQVNSTLILLSATVLAGQGLFALRFLLETPTLS